MNYDYWLSTHYVCFPVGMTIEIGDTMIWPAKNAAAAGTEKSAKGGSAGA